MNTSQESSKPRKGQRITYQGREVGTVDHVDGNLCWVKYDDGTANPFIWRFRDGLNALHDWPGKVGGAMAEPRSHTDSK